MAAQPSRVTNGQRAAVCGLILAGVPFVTACRVAGASRERVRPYIPDDWLKQPLPKRVRDMSDAERRLYRKLQPIVGRTQAAAQSLALP